MSDRLVLLFSSSYTLYNRNPKRLSKFLNSYIVTKSGLKTSNMSEKKNPSLPPCNQSNCVYYYISHKILQYIGVHVPFFY